MNLNGYSQDMDWSETNVDKGVVQSGTRISHTFEYKGIRKIKNIVPLCNCLTYSISGNKYTFRLLVKKKSEDYTTRKLIEIRYTDGTRHYLTIKATVKNEIK